MDHIRVMLSGMLVVKTIGYLVILQQPQCCVCFKILYQFEETIAEVH